MVDPGGDHLAYVKHNNIAGTGESAGFVYASTDRGQTWTPRGKLDPYYAPTLFQHKLPGEQTKLPMMLFCYGNKLWLSVSKDGGHNWDRYPLREFLTDTGGKQTMESGGGAPVLFANGSLHYAFMDQEGGGKWPSHFRIRVASCATSDDPTIASNWTVTEGVEMPGLPAALDGAVASAWGITPSKSAASNLLRGGWLEPSLVRGPDGGVWGIARTDRAVASKKGDAAARFKLSDDRTKIEFVARVADAPGETGFLHAPWAGNSKFHVKWNAETRRYWVLSSPYRGQPSNNPDHPLLRNTMSLYSSADLHTFRHEGDLLEDDLLGDAEASAHLTGFQQPSFEFNGRDIIYLSRTAYGTFDNYHDANMITFHRHRFR